MAKKTMKELCFHELFLKGKNVRCVKKKGHNGLHKSLTLRCSPGCCSALVEIKWGIRYE